MEAREISMADKTTIDIVWDKSGRISHSVSGITYPPPRDNQKLYVLFPSAVFLLAHQFGSMKPSHGLIMSGTVMDMLFDNKYVLVPINSALKGAAIDFVYAEHSVKVLLHPKHGMLANNDSVEEGVRQLSNNYMHYVYTQLDEYAQLVLVTFVGLALTVYFDFLEEQLKAGAIGKSKDAWSMSFPLMSGKLIGWLSQKFYVPPYGTDAQNEQFKEAQLAFHQEHNPALGRQWRSVLTAMGLN
jgi:hypothetical protein